MSRLAHPLIAVAVQTAIAVLFGNWWLGAAVASAAYIMREVTQAEYRWIEQFGSGRRANMPWWGPFDRRVWSVKDCSDWLGPVIATTSLALVIA